MTTRNRVATRAMTCLICKNGTTEEGQATVTLERGQSIIVFKNVPAQVCSTCGEVYVDAEISRKLLERAEAAVTAGVQVEVREFAA